MTFGQTKAEMYVMMLVIWANQKTESFVYHWLRAHATFNFMCFPALVRASDVISSVMSVS